MGRTSQVTAKQALNIDKEIAGLRSIFDNREDKRAENACHSLPDIIMAGFAMFHLKYSSLLSFDTQTEMEKANLQHIYGIANLCSDSTMRRVLDSQNPDFLRDLLSQKVAKLDKMGVLRAYEYKIGAKNYLIVANDGVQYFSSKKISCPCCLTKNHQNGTTTCHHNMLAATLVNPNHREVFPMCLEPIVRQDGCTKNDCELNAAKRQLTKFETDYQHLQRKYNFLFIEDALYANVPHLKNLTGKGNDYLLNVKPDSHKTLFGQIEGRKQRGLVKTFTFTDTDKTKHYFEYTEKILLFEEHPDFRTTFISYTQTDKKGISTTFTWITSLKVNERTLMPIMRAARSRWKVENETFNTLKNQGYHFEHNYGHGKKHLSTFLAYLMFLAFFIDQMIQACCHIFKEIEKNIPTKKKLWETMRSLFMTTIQVSMTAIYRNIAALFFIQLE
jgi:Transposase DDE domain